jgi:hypothetical protein
MLFATMLEAFTGLGIIVVCALLFMLASLPPATREDGERMDWTMRMRRKSPLR